MITNRISRRFCILTFALSLVLMFWVDGVYASRVVSHEIESTAIAKNMVGISNIRHVEVYLPDGYEDEKYRYPVIYYIPGWTQPQSVGGDFFRNVLDDSIKNGKITPTIAVFLDVHEGMLFLNSAVFGNWEDFMVSELIPFIDKTYRTIPDPKARGLTGVSSGGYTALILPILHPNIWGSVGMNDPAFWIMWEFITDEADFPVSLKSDFAWARSVFQTIPQDINGYASADTYARILLQVAASFSPNPNSPIFCDMPVTGGDWVQEAREKWSAYDLINPKTLAKYSETLKNLLSITFIVPEDVATNRVSNIYFIERLQSAGISVTRIDMPGAHGDFQPERFIALTEQLLKAMQGSGTSVSPQGKVATKWGEIKK